MPIAKTDSSSGLVVLFLSEGIFGGGAKESIKNENIMATNISGIHEIPHITGPKGVIQSCPAQLARKIIKKKRKSVLHAPRLDNVANTNVNKMAIRNAQGTI